MRLSRYSSEKVQATCSFCTSLQCKGTWTMTHRRLLDNISRNNGGIMCQPCAAMIKHSGGNNHKCKYFINKDLFNDVNSIDLAYLLGWIASDGSLMNYSKVEIFIKREDEDIIHTLRNIVSRNLPISSCRKKGVDMVGVRIYSCYIVKDACRLLGVNCGKKDAYISMPDLSSDDLKWAFIRGVFDGDGSITVLKGNRPVCSIATTSPKMKESIAEFCKIRCRITDSQIVWNGLNAISFMNKMYCKSDGLRLYRKYKLYNLCKDWNPLSCNYESRYYGKYNANIRSF